MCKKFYSSQWFLKNPIFSLFPIVKMNENYVEIRRVGNLEADFQQVLLFNGGSKPTPFIYLAFKKMDVFIYLIMNPKCWPIHILPFDFLYPFFAGYYTYITVNSYNTKRISSLEKSLSEKYVHIPGCQKNGAFHIGIQKRECTWRQSV